MDCEGREIKFGTALLKDETKETFLWLKQKFYEMHNKTP